MKTLLTLIALALLLVSCEKETITKEVEPVVVEPVELRKFNIVLSFYNAKMVDSQFREKYTVTENDTMYRTSGYYYCVKWTATDSTISPFVGDRTKIRINLNKTTNRFEIVKIK